MELRSFKPHLIFLFLCLLVNSIYGQINIQDKSSSGIRLEKREQERPQDRALAEHSRETSQITDTSSKSLGVTASTRSKPIDPKLILILSERAAIFISKGNYAAALDALDSVLSVNPGLPQAWFNRGVARCSLGDTNGALIDFTRAVEVDPKMAKAYYERGRLKEKINAIGAYVDFAKAIEINPQFFPALLARGKLLFATAREFEALADFNSCLKLNPHSVEALNLHGLLLIKRGENSAALLDFDHAIALNPNLAELWHNRANVRLLQGDLENALHDYNQAVQLKPLAPALNNRGVLFRAQGRVPEAKSDFTKAIETSPNYATAYLNRAQIFLLEGDIANSNRDFLASTIYSNNELRHNQGEIAFSYDLKGLHLELIESKNGTRFLNSNKGKISLK